MRIQLFCAHEINFSYEFLTYKYVQAIVDNFNRLQGIFYVIFRTSVLRQRGSPPSQLVPKHCSHYYLWSWTQKSYKCKIPLKFLDPARDPDQHNNRMVWMVFASKSS